jgi:beta-glucosidase
LNQHFVANDKENDRMAYDSVVSPRALREVYLMPFMIAEKLAQPWYFRSTFLSRARIDLRSQVLHDRVSSCSSLRCSLLLNCLSRYNRLNGTHCSENQELLRNILRGDWKSKATVMSDWFGVYSIDLAINAGLDLVRDLHVRV